MKGFFSRGLGFGLEVGQGALSAALISGKSAEPRLVKLDNESLPGGTVLDSFTQPNIQNMSSFVESVRKLAVRMGRRGRRVNVALPDYVSRVVILDFESIPKKSDDALSMLRWRLKKLLPFEVEEVFLRYQYLGHFGDKGEESHKYLAAVIKSDILAQYEAAINEAGLRPGRIDIASFCIWNLYHDLLTKKAAGGCVCILNMCCGKMTVMVFDGGTIRFFRLKDLGLEGLATGPDGYDVSLVVRELRTSLTYYKENLSGEQVGLVYVAGHMGDPVKVANEIKSGAGLEAEVLSIDQVTGTGGVSLRPGDGVFYGAACGAALER